MNTKSMFESSTIWGAITMLIPVVLTFFKVDVAPDALNAGLSAIQSLINDGIAVVGFAMTVRGRFKAVTPISVLGGVK